MLRCVFEYYVKNYVFSTTCKCRKWFTIKYRSSIFSQCIEDGSCRAECTLADIEYNRDIFVQNWVLNILMWRCKSNLILFVILETWLMLHFIFISSLISFWHAIGRKMSSHKKLNILCHDRDDWVHRKIFSPKITRTFLK